MQVRPVDVKIIETLGDLKVFTLKVPNTPDNRAYLTYNRHIDVYYEQNAKISGILGSPVLKGEYIQCTGKEVAMKLQRRKFQKGGKRVILYENVSALTVVNEILGSIDDFVCIECPTTPISVRFEYSTHFQCLQSVAAALNKDLWFDYYNVYIGDKGSDKGTLNYLSIAKQETDYDSMKNRIFVTGVDSNKNEITVMAQKLSSIYQEAYYTVRDVASESTLQMIANALLDDLQNPLTKAPINISLKEYHSKNLEVGDTVCAVDARQGISVTDRIKRITIQMKGVVRVELGHIKEVMADLYRKLGFQVDIQERSAQTKIAYGTYGFRQGEAFPDDAKDGDTFYRTDVRHAFIFRTLGIDYPQWLPIGKLHFEAEDLPMNTDRGYDEKYVDSTASMGLCKRAQATDLDGHLVYGPYITVPAGPYMPLVCMKVNSNAVHTKICDIDVYIRRGGTSDELVAIRSIYLDDFESPNTWQAFPIGGIIVDEDDTHLETRVYFYNGSAELRVDWTALPGIPGEGSLTDVINVDNPVYVSNVPGATDNTNVPGETGVSTLGPGGRIVAGASNIQVTGSTEISAGAWASLATTLTVPNEDHELLFVTFMGIQEWTSAGTRYWTWAIRILCDGVYYPSSGGVYVNAWNDTTQREVRVFFTVPKNVKGKVITVQVYHGFTGDTLKLSVYTIRCWGHTYHTHDIDDPEHGHDVDDPDHTHEVDDPEHSHDIDDPKHKHW